MQPYKASFDVGAHVAIVDRQALDTFSRTWRFHNALQPEQLTYAGKIARVAKVAFHHGGDPLYELRGVPGVWHEVCLQAATE
jgi:hypothetical protein